MAKEMESLSVDFPPLYKFAGQTNVVLLHQGFHDTYLMTSSGIRYILRIYKFGWKTYEQVAAELTLLLMLGQKGVSVSIPIPDHTGNCIQKIKSPEGDRYAVVFSYASGKPLTALTGDLAFLFGEHLASMHLATVSQLIPGLNREYTLNAILGFVMASILHVIPNHSAAINKLEILCAELGKRFDNVAISDFREGICHGDPHHQNAFADLSTRSLTFFDFDFSGNGLLLYDLGSFCYYERSNPANIISFLAGYESKIPMSKVERAFLTEFKVLTALIHLGARSRNADGIRNAIWMSDDIAAKIDEIEKEMGRPVLIDARM